MAVNKYAILASRYISTILTLYTYFLKYGFQPSVVKTQMCKKYVVSLG